MTLSVFVVWCIEHKAVRLVIPHLVYQMSNQVRRTELRDPTKKAHTRVCVFLKHVIRKNSRCCVQESFMFLRLINAWPTLFVINKINYKLLIELFCYFIATFD